MRCPVCKTEYDTPFCPNGCNGPAAPYITLRQQDDQCCPFCGSSKIGAYEERMVKKRVFFKNRPPKIKTRLIYLCLECGERFH